MVKLNDLWLRRYNDLRYANCTNVCFAQLRLDPARFVPLNRCEVREHGGICKKCFVVFELIVTGPATIVSMCVFGGEICFTPPPPPLTRSLTIHAKTKVHFYPDSSMPKSYSQRGFINTEHKPIGRPGPRFFPFFYEFRVILFAQAPVSSLGRYVFGSEISYNKAPPRLPGLGC